MATEQIGGGSSHDAFARYKRPKLLTKVEGRGNGIKTVITNMTDIAKSLNVDPAYPTKYFGCELGAQSKYDKKTERSVVNGCHDSSFLSTLLNKFIDKFVLCPKCSLPEITLDVDTKKEVIRMDCAACGNNSLMDMTHKLTTYILKNPPEVKGAKKSSKSDKAAKKSERKEKRHAKQKEKHDHEEDDEEEGHSHAASPAHTAHSSKTHSPAHSKAKEVEVEEEEEDDEEWYTDTSAEAARDRKELEMKSMGVQLKAMALAEAPVELAPKDKATPTEVLKEFVESSARTPQEIVSELRRVQLARGLDDQQKGQALIQATLDASKPKTIAQQVKANKKLLHLFRKDTAQTAAQILGLFEEYCGVTESGLMSRVALVWQALYDIDLIDEETMLGWYDSPPESSFTVPKDVAIELRKRAQPFIEWLKNAEEESDDE